MHGVKDELEGLRLLEFPGVDSVHNTVPLYKRPVSGKDQTKMELDKPAFYLHTSGSTGTP
jgi:acyl-coenzyme A synthetase/AMP-(fatty) acid ligase